MSHMEEAQSIWPSCGINPADMWLGPSPPVTQKGMHENQHRMSLPTEMSEIVSYYFMLLGFEMVSYTMIDNYHISLLLPDHIAG